MAYYIRLLLPCALAITLITANYTTISAQEIDHNEEKLAFQYLNKIRQNPKAYGKENGINLDTISPKPSLVWNETLAKAAEAKALDMAKRNYFEHVNPDGYGMNYFINKAGYKLNASWLSDKSLNYFESIDAVAPTGEAAIKDLIIDSEFASDTGWAQYGHRKHLLSLDSFDQGERDIGIGFAICKNGCTYQTYMSVIIAKHNW